MVKVAEDHAGRLRLRVGAGTRVLHDGWYEVVRVGWGIKCANTGLKTVCFLAPPFGCGGLRGVKDGDVVLVVARPEGRQSVCGKGTSGRTQ